MRKVFTSAVVGAVALLWAGPSIAGEPGVKKFCKANVAIDASGDPSPRLQARWSNTAPPEIAAQVDAVLAGFEEQGEAAFEDPAVQAAFAEVDQFVLDNCGYEQVDTTLRDYAFDGIPDEIEKGVVAFNLTNEGTELHELATLRLKGDATLDDILDLPEDATDKQLGKLVAEVPGGGFAFPGASDVALINLKRAGSYVALCFIPVGSTPDAAEEGGSGPPHFMEGMAVEFEVTS